MWNHSGEDSSPFPFSPATWDLVPCQLFFKDNFFLFFFWGGGISFIPCGKFGCLTWVRLQQPQEQRYPFPTARAVFSCVQTKPVLGIFNARTDVNAFDCTWGLCGLCKRVFTESWLWDENPFVHRGIEPALAACCSDTLPTPLHPCPLVLNKIYGKSIRSSDWPFELIFLMHQTAERFSHRCLFWYVFKLQVKLSVNKRRRLSISVARSFFLFCFVLYIHCSLWDNMNMKSIFYFPVYNFTVIRTEDLRL